jgi:hypothetical protein
MYVFFADFEQIFLKNLIVMISKSFMLLTSKYVFLLGCRTRVQTQELRRIKPDMPKNRLHDANSGLLQKAQLLKLKLKAMRSGVWFRALPRIDRVLFDLTLKVAGTVRSFILAKSILAVVRKLESVMESRFLRAVREIGFSIACRLGLIAQRWGNVAAKDWGSDVGFAKYLAAMSINEPKLFNG